MAESEFNWMIGSAIKVTVSDIRAKRTRPTENISSLFIQHKLEIFHPFSMKTLMHTLGWVWTRTRTSRTWWWILLRRSVCVNVECCNNFKPSHLYFIGPINSQSISRIINLGQVQCQSRERLSPSHPVNGLTHIITAFTDFMQTLTFMRPLPQVIGSSGNAAATHLPPSLPPGCQSRPGPGSRQIKRP